MNLSEENSNSIQIIPQPNSNSLLTQNLNPSSVPRKRRRAGRRPNTAPFHPSPVYNSPLLSSQNANLNLSDEIIVINKDSTAEAMTALTAGFPADVLTDEEIDAGVVSVVGGIEQVNYIIIRNHIITKWRENVSTWLTKEMFVNIVPSHCCKLLDSAYEYLVSHGYVNFGVAKEIKEKIPLEGNKSNVIIIGAGLAGLAAARQLMRIGFKVTVLEGRKRAGGRVYTRRVEGGNKFAAADLGGSVLTGTLGNPLGILARQLSSSLHKVRDKCPLYRLDGKPVDLDMDLKVENAFNRVLDRASGLRQLMGDISQDVSLGSALETFRQDYGDAVNVEELNLFNWHLANLEYANAGLLSKLSLAFWDQDDPYDMGGDHCFLPGGNGRLVQALTENVPILYEKTVNTVHYSASGVQVVAGTQVFDGDMVLCTVPLGVLKSGSIKFIPELPQRKLDGIKRLGFGLLNKVAMLFPEVFWGVDLDTFGHLTDDPSRRGEFFLFYSYATVAGGALLIALVAGEAAHTFESMPPTDAVTRVLQILRVPDVSDDIIVINRNTIAEAETALTAGFPSDTLTDEEIHAGVVSVVGGIEQVNYVLIRNHIITKWRENVWNWVSKETFIKTVPPYCIKLLESAYNYLDSYGYINFGVASEIKEKVPVKPIKLRVVIIGAGLAGLAAARQLRRFGFKVIVLEGRKRAGGRVNTWQVEKGNKFAADLGGSVLTGTLGNPLCTLAKQLFLSLYKIRDKCPLYRQDGKPVDPDMDSKVEKRFNNLLDRTSTLRESMGKVSQNVSLSSALDTYGAAENAEELNLFNWHLANLEFANAGLLSKLSLAFWDQDDMYDAGGEHCSLPGGIEKLARALAVDIPILYEKTVNKIHYTDDGVQVFVGNQVFEGDMVLCTVPLGVLKSGSIKFIPDLPQRKIDGIKRLGFGLLNKVAMLFPDVFWDTDLDMFGHLKDDPSQRGEFFLFYNYSSVASGAVLIALVAGEAAFNLESMPQSVVVTRVLQILKDIYEPQGITVPEPIQTVCTRWGSDPFSLGSYSNVAVGSSGDDYDILAENVGDGRVFFAGEATNRRYPATMHGAFLSGLREAAHIARYAKNRSLKKRVEKKPARNPHSQASVLADLFREPDIEFGSYAIIYDKKNTDPKSLAVLRVTFSGPRKENNETNQKHCNKLLFQQLQSHLNQKQEFCIYTLLTRENALELWEVRGGDDMRMKFLTENLGVKLVGRKGLGPMADSVISSIKAERGTRKSGHTSSSLKSGLSKPKPAISKQNLVRRAKIMRKNNGAGFSGIGRGAKPVGTGGLSLSSNQNVAAQVLTGGAKMVGTDVVSLSSLNLSVGDQMLADDNLNRGNSVASVSHITAAVKALDTDVVSPSNLNQNVEDQVPIEDQPSIPHITEEAKPVDTPNSGYNVYNNSCIAGGAEPMDTGAFPLSVFSQNPGGVILGDGNLSVGENGTSPLEAQPVGDVLINYVENQIMGCLLPPEVFIGSEIYSPNMDEGDIISGNSGSSTVAIDIPVEFVQGSVPLPCSYLEDSQMGEQPAIEASLSKSD